MSLQSGLVERLVHSADNQYGQLVVGRVVDEAADGRPLVTFAGCANGPLPAKSLIVVPRDSLIEAMSVLPAFEAGDLSKPVILGVLHDRIHPPDPDQRLAAEPQTKRVTIDGDTLTLEATREVVLRCGKSSITLKKDGSIYVKGTRILSRASQTNKIKGASVGIN